MPVHVHVQSVMNHISGLESDQVIYNWDFVCAGWSAPVFEDGLDEMMNSQVGAANSIQWSIQPTISRVADAHRWYAYDVDGQLDGGPLGSPFDEGAWSLLAADPAATPAPAELQLVVTEHAVGRAIAPVEVGVTRPKSRHTGKWYCGPLTGNTMALVDGEYRFRDAFLAEVSASYQRARNIWLDGGLGLSVWSRADQAMRLIDAIAIDNAPDTQRRRGVDPTRRRVDSVLAP